MTNNQFLKLITQAIEDMEQRDKTKPLHKQVAYILKKLKIVKERFIEYKSSTFSVMASLEDKNPVTEIATVDFSILDNAERLYYSFINDFFVPPPDYDKDYEILYNSFVDWLLHGGVLMNPRDNTIVLRDINAKIKS